MGSILRKRVNEKFFSTWSSQMAYVLGYFVADGCIAVAKGRKNPFTFNITSADKKHLERIKKAIRSTHKICNKLVDENSKGFQIQIRNQALVRDLMGLGSTPRKTYNLQPINVPNKYFPDFVRGFFDGDGTVYVYTVNNTPQIKAGFVSSRSAFLRDFNHRLCGGLGIPVKRVRRIIDKNEGKRMPRYEIVFYVEDSERLAEFMYKSNPVLYLPRKRSIFASWRFIKRRTYIKLHYPSKIGWRLNPVLYASGS